MKWNHIEPDTRLFFADLRTYEMCCGRVTTELRLMAKKDPKKSLAGRIGGHTTASRHNGRELTAKARAKFLGRFEAQVDPDGVLPPAERQRRAEALRKAHFTRLALKSAEARRARKEKKAA